MALFGLANLFFVISHIRVLENDLGIDKLLSVNITYFLGVLAEQ